MSRLLPSLLPLLAVALTACVPPSVRSARRDVVVSPGSASALRGLAEANLDAGRVDAALAAWVRAVAAGAPSESDIELRLVFAGVDTSVEALMAAGLVHAAATKADADALATTTVFDASLALEAARATERPDVVAGAVQHALTLAWEEGGEHSAAHLASTLADEGHLDVARALAAQVVGDDAGPVDAEATVDLARLLIDHDAMAPACELVAPIRAAGDSARVADLVYACGGCSTRRWLPRVGVTLHLAGPAGATTVLYRAGRDDVHVPADERAGVHALRVRGDALLSVGRHGLNPATGDWTVTPLLGDAPVNTLLSCRVQQGRNWRQGDELLIIDALNEPVEISPTLVVEDAAITRDMRSGRSFIYVRELGRVGLWDAGGVWQERVSSVTEDAPPTLTGAVAVCAGGEGDVRPFSVAAIVQDVDTAWDVATVTVDDGRPEAALSLVRDPASPSRWLASGERDWYCDDADLDLRITDLAGRSQRISLASLGARTLPEGASGAAYGAGDADAVSAP